MEDVHRDVDGDGAARVVDLEGRCRVDAQGAERVRPGAQDQGAARIDHDVVVRPRGERDGRQRQDDDLVQVEPDRSRSARGTEAASGS